MLRRITSRRFTALVDAALKHAKESGGLDNASQRKRLRAICAAADFAAKLPSGRVMLLDQHTLQWLADLARAVESAPDTAEETPTEQEAELDE